MKIDSPAQPAHPILAKPPVEPANGFNKNFYSHDHEPTGCMYLQAATPHYNHSIDMQASALTPGRLLRIKQFIPHILPMAESTFWAGVKSGKFPKPIKLSERVTCWRSEDIIAVRDNIYHNAA